MIKSVKQKIKRQMQKFFKIIFFLIGGFVMMSVSTPPKNYYNATGEVSFTSKAPLEVIEATSLSLQGILDRATGEFAFSITIKSFEGFNSPLQKEHFNEHYLESALYPKSTYSGTLLGFKDCETNCELKLNAKGKFMIHNITKVLIIPITFVKKEDKVSGKADFDIKLEDFDISIPKILESKISPIIKVMVRVNFNIGNA